MSKIQGSADGAASSKPSVSVIIPTINEAKNLPLVLPFIPLDVVDEVILVDGKSTDNTISVAKRLLPSIKIVLEPRHGKGAALRRGYHEAVGDILVVLDADGSNDPREIPRFIQVLVEGADFAKGSRFVPPGGTTDMPRLRKMGNWAFVEIVNTLFSQNFTDLCYGFHAFWRHCLDYLDLTRVEGFEVDTSIYLQAVNKKLKIVDIASFEGYRFYGTGKLQTFPDGWRVLRTIFGEWLRGRRHPSQLPQVGFRSFYRVPLSQIDQWIPVTGLPKSQLQLETNGSSAPVNPHQRYTLQTLFQTLLCQNPGEESGAVLSDILLIVVDHLGASSGSLLVVGRDQLVIDGYLAFGRNIEPAPLGNMMEVVSTGVASEAICKGKPILIRSTRSDPRWMHRPWEEEEDVSRSALVFPILHDNCTAGVLTLTRPEDRRFTEADIEHLKSISVYL